MIRNYVEENAVMHIWARELSQMADPEHVIFGDVKEIASRLGCSPRHVLRKRKQALAALVLCFAMYGCSHDKVQAASPVMPVTQGCIEKVGVVVTGADGLEFMPMTTAEGVNLCMCSDNAVRSCQ